MNCALLLGKSAPEHKHNESLFLRNRPNYIIGEFVPTKGCMRIGLPSDYGQAGIEQENTLYGLTVSGRYRH